MMPQRIKAPTKLPTKERAGTISTDHQTDALLISPESTRAGGNTMPISAVISPLRTPIISTKRTEDLMDTPSPSAFTSAMVRQGCIQVLMNFPRILFIPFSFDNVLTTTASSLKTYEYRTPFFL